jgi:hypothetical protein
MGLGGKSVFNAYTNTEVNLKGTEISKNKTMVNEKFQSVLKTLASNLKESKENVQDRSNQG